MCTLTAIPTARGVRVAFNRDELRTRPVGLRPVIRRHLDRSTVYPTDPISGGTWLAATDAGLILALLNVNRPGPIRRGQLSRGLVIPAVLNASTVSDAIKAVPLRIEMQRYAPFRLVAISGGVVASLFWDGDGIAVKQYALDDEPVMFTSSGLGDDHVVGPRTELFHQIMTEAEANWPTAQDLYHRHRWVDRPELSVNMCRADARTVSHAVVEIDQVAIRFVYHPDAPDHPGDDTTIDLTPTGGR